MKKFFKNKKGITLIALVITIVILIILAGVAISLSIGENGLISRAKQATQEYSNAQSKEEQDINDLYGQMLVATDGTVTIDASTLSTMIQKEVTKQITASSINTYNYSTEEQVIGTWLDGKPLYQKTVTTSIEDKTSLTKNSYYQVIYELKNDEELKQFNASYLASNGNVENLPFVFYTDNNTTSVGLLKKSIRVNYNDTSKTMGLIEQGNPEYFISFNVRLTIQYTKTTDQAKTN